MGGRTAFAGIAVASALLLGLLFAPAAISVTSAKPRVAALSHMACHTRQRRFHRRLTRGEACARRSAHRRPIAAVTSAIATVASAITKVTSAKPAARHKVSTAPATVTSAIATVASAITKVTSAKPAAQHKVSPAPAPAPAPAPGQSIFGIAAGGGIQNEDPTTLARDLNLDRGAGAQWLRIDINWAQIQRAGPSTYDWGPIDAVVQGAEARGMKVLGAILYTPSWDRPLGTSVTYGPSPSSYASFASVAVAHYAALGVQAYELWNEPNTSAFWTPAPSPAAYTALLRAAYPTIKAADPSATVLTGGTAPAPTDGTNYSPVDFLSGVYANGGEPYFDAVAAHPYCWPANPGDADLWSAWYQMYGTSPSLRSVMIANGDGGKKIWGTEFGAPTNGLPGGYVSESTQAAMIGQAYQLWSTYSWAGPLFVYQGRDQGTDASNDQDYFGMARYDFSLKPSYSAYQQAVASY